MAILYPRHCVTNSLNFDDFAENSANLTKISMLSPTSTPEFIEQKPWYISRSYEISGYSHISMTRYKATSINVIDYDYFTVIDYKTKRKRWYAS